MPGESAAALGRRWELQLLEPGWLNPEQEQKREALQSAIRSAGLRLPADVAGTVLGQGLGVSSSPSSPALAR